MIAVATGIGDKINRELRTIGANLVVTPQEDTLDVEIGGVNLKPPRRWGVSRRSGPAEDQRNFLAEQYCGLCADAAGERRDRARRANGRMSRWWEPISPRRFLRQGGVHHRGADGVSVVEGTGAGRTDDSADVLLGERLAAHLARSRAMRSRSLARQLRVSGILSTGGAEDDQIVAPLSLAQEILGKPGAVGGSMSAR